MSEATGYMSSAYAIPLEPPTVDPFPVPFVPVVPLPGVTLDISRELIEALVRQAVREHEDRISDLEKRLAMAESRIAKLDAELEAKQ